MNKELLYEEIKKQNVKIVDLCNYVGFSKSAFYRKVDEKTQFTLFEMKKIIQYLNFIYVFIWVILRDGKKFCKL